MPKSPRKLRIVALALAATLALTAWVITRSTIATRIVSDRAPIELTVPHGWKVSAGKAFTNPHFALRAASADGELGVDVLFKPKRYSDMQLDGYAAMTLSEMDQRSLEMTHTDWVPIKVGTADGLQCDAHLIVASDYSRMGYVVTVFGTADSYFKVLSWTGEPIFADRRAVLAALPSGFRQTGPLPASRPATGDPVTIKAKNGFGEMIFPAGWSTLPEKASVDDAAASYLVDQYLAALTNPNFVLAAINANDELLVSVSCQPKRYLDAPLNAFGAMVLREMGRRSSDLTHTDWVPIKVASTDALQCDVHMVVGRIKLGSVVTVFGTAESYVSMVGATSDIRFTDYRSILAGLASGFRQTGSLPATRPAIGGPVTVKAKNGLEEMVLPAGWIPSQKKTTQTTQLFAYNQYMGVALISENQGDPTLDLSEYADFVLDHLCKQGTEVSHTPWAALKVNGCDALRCDLRLTNTKQMKSAYVVTVLQTPARLEYVLAWCNASSFDEAKPMLEGLAFGLRQISPSR